mgnify:CR=1 FL=1
MVVVFSGSGTSGQDHKTAVCRLNDCRLLHLIQLDLIFFLDLSDPLFDCLTVFLACNIQLMQHARRTQFQIIILAGVHNPQRLIPFPFGRELADDLFLSIAISCRDFCIRSGSTPRSSCPLRSSTGSGR